MVSIVDNPIISLLSLALDAAAMRQQAIAQNIANAHTLGYQRLGVSFESRVSDMQAGRQNGASPSLANLSDFRPSFELADAEAVQLDTELASLSENTLHHQVLVKALSKELALLGIAINGEKR